MPTGLAGGISFIKFKLKGSRMRVLKSPFVLKVIPIFMEPFHSLCIGKKHLFRLPTPDSGEPRK